MGYIKLNFIDKVKESADQLEMFWLRSFLANTKICPFNIARITDSPDPSEDKQILALIGTNIWSG